jgi:predicted outer membrane repeat protein
VTGQWQAFGNRVHRGDFPRVTREAAARSASDALGARLSPSDLRAVGMPNKHLYWQAGEPGGREVFINIADRSDIHIGLDEDISPPQRSYEPPVDAAERSTGWEAPGAPDEGEFHRDYPDSYDIAGVPYHVQQGAYDCGPASAEMVMDYWGADIDQQDIADVANCLSPGGSYNDDIRRSGHFSAVSTAVQNASLQGYDERKLGYAALDQWWSLGGTGDPDYPDRYNDLRTLVSSDYPLLLLTLYNTSGSGHFRVVKGYNDITDVFIVHDPWYSDPYQGPDVNFNQTFFVDTLWAGIASRWATLIMPWEVQVSAPANVGFGATFTVQAIIYYHGPHPFEGQDGASSREVEIDMSSIFTLAPGETALQTLPGTAPSGLGNLVTWDVVADTVELGGVFDVVARGLISDSSTSYASGYSDSIGGWGNQGVTIWDPDLIFVDVAGGGDFLTIQAGLDYADSGDTVCVWPGIYAGPLNRDLDFHGKDIYLTSSEGSEVTIIECEVSGRGFTLTSGEGPGTIVEGFTIANGMTTGTSFPDNTGGGMLLVGSSPTIRDVVFEGNVASNAGGGLCCTDGASPQLLDCEFLWNVAEGTGGGGMLCSEGSSSWLTRVKFIGNSGHSQGGGLWTYMNSSPVLEECTFVGNTTLFDGGAIALWESPGGIVMDCTLVDNAGGNVGGIHCYNATPQVTNTIIAYGLDGFAVGCGSSVVSFEHCCVYGNAFGDSLCGIYQGQGNIYEDPLFCNEQQGAYYLQDCSPCLGAGIGGDDIGAWPAGCPCGDPTGVDDEMPTAFLLHPARPSPFDGSTMLQLDVPLDAGHVTLAVYNVRGQLVRTLADGALPRGRREFIWNGTDDTGRPVSAGIYLARCESDAGTSTQKLVLMK